MSRSSRAEAKSAIFSYIEVFYNRVRLHGALGFYSPVDFANQLNEHPSTLHSGWSSKPEQDHYLAGILDARTRRPVGGQTGATLAATLVTQAWQKAVRERRPAPGLLHHSDRGVQYASEAMRALLAESGAAASMSRRGHCDRQRHDGEVAFGGLADSALGHPQSRMLPRGTACHKAGRSAANLRLRRGLL